MDSSKKYDNPSPEDSANILSKIFFCWILPFFKNGYKNDLQLKDIYKATSRDQCGKLADELEKNWEAELKRASVSKKNKKPSLKKAIFKTFVKPFSLYGIYFFIQVIYKPLFQNTTSFSNREEIKEVSKTSYVKALSLSMMVFTERLSLYLTIVTFVLLGNRLTSDIVFSMAQLFNTAQLYICIAYPNGLATYAEAKVSIGRLEEFLGLEEQSTTAVLNGTVSADKPGRVKMEKATASWSLAADTLIDINLDIPPGTLCCVVGSVGSGKSSLLHVLLKELPLNCGKVDVSGEISYASQEPWLFVSSVRDNILFGKPYIKQRYEEVVRVCALETDISQFPHGDKTLVEEKGVSLSGGQRARINLARAVYATADVYLFDDPLSAVDTHVGKHLFEECIKGYLKNKTRILVTHQLQVLKQADLIVIIDKGKIQRIGTYKDISETDLSTLYAEPASEESNDADSRKKSGIENIQEHLTENEEPEESVEAMGSGSIPVSSYWEYYRNGAGLFILLSLLFLLIAAQIASNGCDLWVTYWTNMESVTQNTAESLSSNITDPSGNISKVELSSKQIYKLEDQEDTTTEILLGYQNVTAPPLTPFERQEYYIIVYSGFMLASILLTPARSVLFYKIFMRASKNLHNRMFTNVLAAPMRFFDTNPSGRILSRFSNDMGIIDELLPRASLEAIQVLLVMAGILMCVFIVTPWMVVPAALMGFLFYFVRVVYIKTAQDVKRLEGVNRAPVFSHILASLYGMPTIRASKAQKMVILEFDSLQDQHTGTWFMYIATSEIFGYYLDIISTLFIALVTFQFLLFKTEADTSGDVGLVISQSLILSGMLQIGVRQTAEVASNMISVERVLQYTKVEPEVNAEQPQPKKIMSEDWAHYAKLTYKNPDKNWPQSGKICFKKVFLRYGADAQPVLKDLNVVIGAGEKVGIVGRTGAGKSSLISALFRLTPIEGTISIDGVDTAKVRLSDLRSKISIIPQEPVLFSATVRYNLDPFGNVSDEQLWQALENVELKSSIESLDQNVNEGGSNFSVGQRQLICLARAIVRNNKVLVLDEATANVDPHTDSLIQKTIRENFKRCTVLTIAHRLNTIMDSNKVLVMSSGEIVEFAHPHKLLQKPDGYFAKMVRQTGTSMDESLRRIAKEHYKQTARVRDFQ
nr:probable multidrug resistance-associated protein lethal(2)03659 [Leptinotarsa decemlineata]